MSAIKIDKGVPISEAKRKGRKSKYPVQDMEIGDSFFCNDKAIATLRVIAGSLNNHYKPMRFVSRMENDGVRIWRVK